MQLSALDSSVLKSTQLFEFGRKLENISYKLRQIEHARPRIPTELEDFCHVSLLQPPSVQQHLRKCPLKQ